MFHLTQAEQEEVIYPICLLGEHACPPGDCGGAWGYEELLEILGDSGDKKYECYRDWVREDFDPEIRFGRHYFELGSLETSTIIPFSWSPE